MKYSYDNKTSVKNYHKKIRDGFKRFHSMNAQERTFGLELNGNTRFLVMQFVSYDTEIMQVIYDYEYNSFTVHCNDNPFNWSCSTSRQLSRWLYESQVISFDSGLLRAAYEHCHSVTPELSVYRVGNIEFNFYDDYRTFYSNWR